MAITEDDICVCDYCGEDTGKFNQDTGNHPSCEELAVMRFRLDYIKNNISDGVAIRFALEASDAEIEEAMMKGE